MTPESVKRAAELIEQREIAEQEIDGLRAATWGEHCKPSAYKHGLAVSVSNMDTQYVHASKMLASVQIYREDEFNVLIGGLREVLKTRIRRIDNELAGLGVKGGA